MQSLTEKRMRSREIILKGRSSLTGIDIETAKKRLIMKVESLRGAQTSVSSSALQVRLPVARCERCLDTRLAFQNVLL